MTGANACTERQCSAARQRAGFIDVLVGTIAGQYKSAMAAPQFCIGLFAFLPLHSG
jgi:hypothetical protein